MKVLLVTTALLATALCAAPAPPPRWTPSGRLLLVPAHLEQPKTSNQPETNTTGVAQESESDESKSEKLLESGEYYVLLPDGRLQMVKYATAALKAEEAKDSKETTKEQTQEQQFQHAYYIQAQEEQKQEQASQFAQAAYQQPQAAYYIQAQKEEQPAQYNNAPYMFQQKFQQAAYPVFIRPTEAESSQYNAAENFQQFQKPADSKFQQVKQEPSLQIDFVQFPLQGSQQFSQTKLQLSEVKSAENKAEKEEGSGFEANLQYTEVKPISAPIYAYNPTPLVRILKK